MSNGNGQYDRLGGVQTLAPDLSNYQQPQEGPASAPLTPEQLALLERSPYTSYPSSPPVELTWGEAAPKPKSKLREQNPYAFSKGAAMGQSAEEQIKEQQFKGKRVFEKKLRKVHQFTPEIRDASKFLRAQSEEDRSAMIDDLSPEETDQLNAYLDFVAQEPIYEMHPIMDNPAGRAIRLQLQNQTSDPAEQARALEELYPGMVAAADPDGTLRMKFPWEEKQHVLDPPITEGFPSFQEVVSDFTDPGTDMMRMGVSTQLGREWATILGSAGSMLPGIAGKIGRPVGSMLGYGIGGLMSGAGIEAASQEAGMLSGMRTQRQPDWIAQQGLTEAALNLLPGQTGASGAPLSPWSRSIATKAGQETIDLLRPMVGPAQGLGRLAEKAIGGPTREVKDIMYRHAPELKAAEEMASGVRKDIIRKTPVSKKGSSVGHLKIDADLTKDFRRDTGNFIKEAKRRIRKEEVEPALKNFDESQRLDLSDIYGSNKARIDELKDIRDIDFNLAPDEAIELKARQKFNKIMFTSKGPGEVDHPISSRTMTAFDVDRRKQLLQEEAAVLHRKLEPGAEDRFMLELLDPSAEKIVERLNTKVPGYQAGNARYTDAKQIEDQMLSLGFLEDKKGVSQDRSYMERMAGGGKPNLQSFKVGATEKDEQTINAIRSGKAKELIDSLDQLKGQLTIGPQMPGRSFKDQAEKIQATEFFMDPKNLAVPPKGRFVRSVVAGGGASVLGTLSNATTGNYSIGYGLGALGVGSAMLNQSRLGTRFNLGLGRLGKDIPVIGPAVGMVKDARPIRRSIFREDVYPWAEEFAPELMRDIGSAYDRFEEAYIKKK